MGLTVWANYPNGTRIPGSYRSMPNDLILDQFNKLMEDVLATGNGFTILTTGASLFATGQSGSCAGGTYANSCGVNFEIGTGATSVTRTDTMMNAVYTPTGTTAMFSDTATNPALTTTANPATCVTGGSTDYVNGVSGSQVITGSATITEVGLFATDWTNSNAATHLSMWFHDGISPGVAVVSGDTFTVNYQVNLNNPGFTDNFCKVIASFLTGDIALNGAEAVTLKDTTGGTATFYNWCEASGAVNLVANPFSTSATCMTKTGQGGMIIGKGTTPFAPTTYALSSPLGSVQATATRTYASPQNFYTTTFTISGSSNSITEACEGITLSAKFYCLFGLTFTGQPQSSGVPFGFTLRTGD